MYCYPISITKQKLIGLTNVPMFNYGENASLMDSVIYSKELLIYLIKQCFKHHWGTF